MAVDPSFAEFCCELLAPVGRCVSKRMFGGFGISIDGITFAIVADLGEGPQLWLKADEALQARFEAAGSQRFTYRAKGVERSAGYYSAPPDAMESPQLMAPWARQAFDCALRAHSSKGARTGASKPQASRAKPPARRPAAPTPSKTARRKSARG